MAKLFATKATSKSRNQIIYNTHRDPMVLLSSGELCGGNIVGTWHAPLAFAFVAAQAASILLTSLLIACKSAVAHAASMHAMVSISPGLASRAPGSLAGGSMLAGTSTSPLPTKYGKNTFVDAPKQMTSRNTVCDVYSILEKELLTDSTYRRAHYQ